MIRNLEERQKSAARHHAETKGPEIRLGAIEGDAVPLKSETALAPRQRELHGQCRSGWFDAFPRTTISKRGQLLFDDGYIQASVVKKSSAGVLEIQENEGVIKRHV